MTALQEEGQKIFRCTYKPHKKEEKRDCIEEEMKKEE